MSEITQDTVLQALKNVQDPDLKKDIVSLGFVKNVNISGNEVSFTLELTTPACPMKDQMKRQAEESVLALPGIERVNIDMTSRVRTSVTQKEDMLPGVKNVVAVASGKGGVGKSTISANLALALGKTGAKVGLMDADVYGPSIPGLLGITAPNIEQIEGGDSIRPIDQYGVKVISMGFFLPADKAAIWRGPMLHQMISQFLNKVAWEELDYLVIDLPPGTGDAHLSICQSIELTGAVVVSTPQDIALNVAQKALFMFEKMNCPILGIVENMSHHICSHCGTREDIFGSGGAKDFSKRMNIPFLGEIPLVKAICEESDKGTPIVISQPDSPHAKAFFDVAKNLAAQISIAHMSKEK